MRLNRFLYIFDLQFAIIFVLLPSVATAAAGTVFSFGANRNGQTGLGTDTGNTLAATAIDTSNLASRSITQVAVNEESTSEHSLLLAKDGSVFSFVWNSYRLTSMHKNIGEK
jgi:alpha-tubulin suppressor-like RCC1 family protein